MKTDTHKLMTAISELVHASQLTYQVSTNIKDQNLTDALLSMYAVQAKLQEMLELIEEKTNG